MKKQVQAHLPSIWGDFDLKAYSSNPNDNQAHLALVHKEVNIHFPVTVRIHSECLTGDLFGSTRCDCGEQLAESLRIIGENKGVLIYLRQEGRGIGLINKLKAYNLQDQGLNTIDANVHLGFEPDQRDYDMAVFILKELGIKSIDLLTNNPEKLNAINLSEIILNSRVPLVVPPRENNKAYMDVKQEKMGHLLKI
ncbi:MAG: GTP cyclohydrolase II [Saprospiraceae bacterium]|nr:GTP cyclohydrolase II [Saprospiraceae bacterium]